MSETEDAGDVPELTNYVPLSKPRKLTQAEARDAAHQTVREHERAFYAIKREDGHVGGRIPSYDPSAKIRVLYVTADGRRSFTLMHDAEETEDGEHRFGLGFESVVSREPRAGFETATRSIEAFRSIVADRYEVDR